MREYINSPVKIDGRNIPYPVFTAADYLTHHDGIADVERFIDTQYEIYEYLTKILALKQSCFLLRHTTHSCQSLSDALYKMKCQMICELAEKYDYLFDDSWMEQLVESGKERT